MKKLSPPTSQSRSPAKAQGFTLIELLSTVVVLGVVLSVGVPSLFETIQNNRLVAQTNQTTGMIAYARSEAAKRPGTTITLCASTNVNAITPVCNSNNWESGWFMMADLDGDRILNNIGEDVNGNNVLDPGEDLNGDGIINDATDELLRVSESLTGNNTLRTSGFTVDGAVQFDSTGIPDAAGTFTICDDRGAEKAKSIVLSVIGHARVAVDEDEPRDEIVNNHAGANVTCPAS